LGVFAWFARAPNFVAAVTVHVIPMKYYAMLCHFWQIKPYSAITLPKMAEKTILMAD